MEALGFLIPFFILVFLIAVFVFWPVFLVLGLLRRPRRTRQRIVYVYPQKATIRIRRSQK
jgi:hypothetical protein